MPKLKPDLRRSRVDRPVSVERAAAALGVHRRTVERWLVSGKLDGLYVRDLVKFAADNPWRVKDGDLRTG